jgi:hypothetical protein
MQDNVKDKTDLLMEETGCDRAQAQLALELAGYEMSTALRTIASLLRHIVVIKAKFIHPDQDRFGLVLIALNAKSGEVLRSRSVLSFNPAIHEISLDKGWFEFNRQLYAVRLWEGSLPEESLALEQTIAEHFKAKPLSAIEALAHEGADDGGAEIELLLGKFFHSPVHRLKVVKDVIDLGRFQSLDAPVEPKRSGRRRGQTPSFGGEDLLVLKLRLVEGSAGILARELRSGDMVSASIEDDRDIARYLAKLLGAFSEGGGMAPILAPVEAIESGPDGVLVRLRFSSGVCGDARVSAGVCLKAVRIAVRNQEKHSWFRRFFGGA